MCKCMVLPLKIYWLIVCQTKYQLINISKYKFTLFCREIMFVVNLHTCWRIFTGLKIWCRTKNYKYEVCLEHPQVNRWGGQVLLFFELQQLLTLVSFEIMSSGMKVSVMPNKGQLLKASFCSPLSLSPACAAQPSTQPARQGGGGPPAGAQCALHISAPSAQLNLQPAEVSPLSRNVG